jgi:hypothetical protein
MEVQALLDALNGGKPITATNPLQVADPTPKPLPVEDTDKEEDK